MYGLRRDDDWQLGHVGTGDVHVYVNSYRCVRWCIGKVQGAGRRAGGHLAGMDDESMSYWPTW
jgi:hypothetical protein